MAKAAKHQRFHWVKATAVTGKCEDCSWSTKALNGQGAAAQHHDLYGHTVEATVSRTYVYEKLERYERRTGQKVPQQGKLL